MNIKSSKAKGRRLQNWVRDKLREVFVNNSLLPKLYDDDIKSQTMGMTGEDIVLSPAAKKIIPYSFECKNQEKISIWKCLKQTENNCGKRIPVLVIKKNKTKVYAVIEFNTFINKILKK